MSLGQVVLGVASVVMGLNHLNNGAKHLTKPSRRRNGMGGLGRMSPVAVPGRPFHNSGHRPVRTRNGAAPMRMRSYNIRTLDDRIRYLRHLADSGKRDPQIYAFARQAVGKKCGGRWCVPEKDNTGEARALYAAMRSDPEKARRLFKNIRKNVRYTSDILGVDTYQRPGHTLLLGSGDCDDYSSLTCAALGSLGIPCRFKVIRTKDARDWNHIYAQAGFPRQAPRHWISMDSSVNKPFGWEAPRSMVAASRVFRA